MSEEKKKPKKDEEVSEALLRQMVDARGKIQNELIDLRAFKKRYQNELKGGAAGIRSMGLLTSAAFSLWRAAFLFQHSLDAGADEYFKGLDTFLYKVILSNTIGFMDDQNTWSVWHYIGVARSSLLEARGLQPQPFAVFSNSRGLDYLLSEDNVVKLDAEPQWHNLLEALQVIRRGMAANYDVRQAMIPLPGS